MAVDLNEMFDSAMDEGARELAGAAPPEGAVEAWVRQVRRRRTARYTVRAAVLVPVATALGLGLWFGAGELLDEAPVATPSPIEQMPTPSSDPSPDPSADPTSDASPDPTPDPDPTTAPPPELLEVPGLPAYFEAPEDVLSLAEEGWLLSVYQVGEESRGEWPESVGTLFLSSPTGESYRLADVDAEWIELHYWQPGSDRARVTFASDSEGLPSDHTTGWLDVLSGAVVADERSIGFADFLGFAADGSEVWYSFETFTVVRPDGGVTEFLAEGGAGQTAVLNPAGTHVAIESEDDGEIVLVDIDGQASEVVDLGAAGDDCRAVGWLSDDAVLAQCEEGASRVTVVGGVVSAEPLGDALAGLYAHQGGINAGEEAVVLSFLAMAELEADPGLEACAPPAGVWVNGDLVEVPAFGPSGKRAVGTRASHGGVIYLGGEYICSFGEDAPLEELVRFDPATGEISTVLPIISFGGSPADGGTAIGAVVSWTIAR